MCVCQGREGLLGLWLRGGRWLGEVLFWDGEGYGERVLMSWLML